MERKKAAVGWKDADRKAKVAELLKVLDGMSYIQASILLNDALFEVSKNFNQGECRYEELDS